MHPSEFFEDTPAVVGGRCFVAMPFSLGFSKEVYDAISSALKEFDITCYRADEVIRGGEVMTDVLSGLAEAELVIVDLTGSNPNVFYELGIAHTIRCAESVWLLTQDMRDVPFDVNHYRCIEYALGDDGLSKLKSELAHLIKKNILPSRLVYRWSEHNASVTSDRLLGEDRTLYSFSICDVLPGRNTAQFRLVVFRHYPGRPPKQVYSKVQEALQPGETVPIPKVPWAIKLHEASSDEALFCVCRPEPKAA
jgi:hypothetical protein